MKIKANPVKTSSCGRLFSWPGTWARAKRSLYDALGFVYTFGRTQRAVPYTRVWLRGNQKKINHSLTLVTMTTFYKDNHYAAVCNTYH